MKETQKKIFNISLKGEVEVRGKVIKHLEGGFGENCKIISDKDIAIEHDMQPKHVRELINKNIKRFKEDIDYIDLKQRVDLVDPLTLGYAKQSITQADHIYILSERGYSKIIKIMDNDLAWEIYDDLLDNYFTLRKTVKNLIKDSYLINDPIARAEAWIQEQKEKQALQLENKQQKQIIGELQPKATYYDLVLQSTGLTPISLIAKDYGMSAVTLNKRLHEFGVQYKQSDTWLLYAKYQDKGYTQSKTQTYQKGDGTTGTRLHTQWTQKGRLFLYGLLKQNNILPVIER